MAGIIAAGFFPLLGEPRTRQGRRSPSTADKVENVISQSLYGQFAEFMFQDIKGGSMRNWCAIEASTSNRMPSVYRDTGSVIRMTGTMMQRCALRGTVTFILLPMGMRTLWPASTRFAWMSRANSNNGEAFVKDGFPFMRESTTADMFG